jgi:hypothetical protein
MIMQNPLRRICTLRKALKKRFKDLLFLYEHSQRVPISTLNKLRMWKNGFLSQSYLIYGFQENDFRDYLSDHARLKQVIRINGYYSVVLYDKLYFALLLRAFEDYVARTYALVKGRRVTLLDDARSTAIESLIDLCREKGAVVLKPLAEAHGVGVMVIKTTDNTITLNGQQVSGAKFVSIAEKMEDYLVTEFAPQHDYASAIFPRTTNTVRIMTLWDEDANEPFVAMAVHRFGISKTFPVDSWTQGGVSALIDLQTGAMGKAAAKPVVEAPQFTEKHPETGARIEGVIVPHWEIIKSKILDMAAALPFVPCIGWDIVVTKAGFKVIEGNNCPDILLFQIHAPLLANPRIRRFYERHIARLTASARSPAQYKLPFKI